MKFKRQLPAFKLTQFLAPLMSYEWMRVRREQTIFLIRQLLLLEFRPQLQTLAAGPRFQPQLQQLRFKRLQRLLLRQFRLLHRRNSKSISTPAPVNTPAPTPSARQNPVAHDDGPYEMALNQQLNIAVADLLSNDTDPSGLALSLTAFANPSSGTLSKNGDTFTFHPTHNFTGTVTFLYTVTNSLNLSAQATVTINVRTPASEAIYGESTSTLYRYDPNTQISSAIASFRLGSTSGTLTSLFDIAITSNGLMYGVDGSHLYYVDADTGVLALVETTGLASFKNVNGLTALSDNRLVISGDGIAIYDIAKQTLTTLLAPGTYTSSGDVIALPDGYLYMSAMIANSDDHLIRIDATNGTTRDMGSLGRTKVYGLGYAYGVVYGFDANKNTFQIDPSNAATSHVTTSDVKWYGATTNPVLW